MRELEQRLSAVGWPCTSVRLDSDRGTTTGPVYGQHCVVAVLQFARGLPPAKRIRRETVRHQDRLRTLCQRQRAGEITMPEFLRAVVHAIRLDK